jgi:Uri superfamily endonuclease
MMLVTPGFYVYLGSAFGPGGVRARVQRHRVRARCRHWHVDYLRSVTRLAQVWFSYDQERREHAWADVVGKTMQGTAPLAGFGASDCSCGTHLYYFPVAPSAATFEQHLRRRVRGHDRVWVEALA